MATLEARRPLVNADRTRGHERGEKARLAYSELGDWGTGLATSATGWEAAPYFDAIRHVNEQRVWWLTQDLRPAGCALVSEGETTAGMPTVLAPMEPKSDPLDPVAIADRLQEWLGLTIDDLAAIADIGKTTIYYWHRENGKPRPATVHRLLRAYALIQALITQRGVQGTAIWLRTGNPSSLELLKVGAFEDVEDRASAMLFSSTSRQMDYAAYRAEDEDVDDDTPLTASPTTPLRRASRVPRRGRLAK